MPKRSLRKQVIDLKAQHEAFNQMVMEDMADLFNLPVSAIVGYQQDGQTETGILVSGGIRYRFKVDGDLGTKELVPEPG